MIGSLIGGALSIGGAIAGGISAAKASANVKKSLESQQAQNRAWYDRRYNESATQRADAQRVLAEARDQMLRRSKASAGAAAVSGATEESLASAKAADAAAQADLLSRIAASGEARKDSIENQYMARDSQLQGQLDDLELRRAGAVSSAIGGVADAASGIASAF